MSLSNRSLETVATVLDNRCITVQGTQRLLRKGPYRLFVESGCIPFDDYLFDGNFLLLGSVCNVVSPGGTLRVTRAYGKTAATQLHHVIAAKQDEDTEYLYRVLSLLPAEQHAEISGQTERMSEQSLRHIALPWLAQQDRRAFVSYMDGFEAEELAREQKIRALFERGAALYDALEDLPSRVDSPIEMLCAVCKGRPLDASLRSARGRIPVVSSQGVFGRTDEVGTEGPCVVIGQAGQYVLAYRMSEGAYPLPDACILSIADASIPYELLVFGLYAKGARQCIRVVDNKVDALAMRMEQLIHESLNIGDLAARESFHREAAPLLLKIEALEVEASRAALQRQVIVAKLLGSDESVVADLAPWRARAVLVPQGSGEEELLNKEDSVFRAAYRGVDIREEGKISVRGKLNDLVLDVQSFVAHAMQAPVSSFDVVWEVLPLLFLRAIKGPRAWKELCSLDEPTEALDTWLEEVAISSPSLAFLRNISSESSCLTKEVRSRILASIEALPAEEITDNLLRWLSAEFLFETVQKKGVSMDRRIDAPCPDAVCTLIAGIAVALRPQATQVFDPCCREGSILAAVREVLPEAEFLGQTTRYADILAGTMADYCQGITRHEEAFMVGNSLEQDAFDTLRTDLVVSLAPPNAGDWTTQALDENDPRWVFGVPPRNKANLAWLQHSYVHCAPQGYAVLAFCNSVLHEGRGCEPAVRRELILSGCVRMVIALPGRLFEDDRPPLCLIVLGHKRDEGCETLFINALEEGKEQSGSEGVGQRTLPADAIVRILTTVKEWLAAGSFLGQKGFSRSVGKEELLEQGDLSPWAFM